MLRRAKSGELVTVALPAEVIVVLELIVQPSQPHYFCTGTSELVTVVKFWRKQLKARCRRRWCRGFPPSPAPRHLRGRTAGRGPDAGRLQPARPRERHYDRALLRALEPRPARAPQADCPGSSPAGSDPVGIHTQKARGDRNTDPRGGQLGNTPRSRANPSSSGQQIMWLVGPERYCRPGRCRDIGERAPADVVPRQSHRLLSLVSVVRVGRTGTEPPPVFRFQFPILPPRFRTGSGQLPSEIRLGNFLTQESASVPDEITERVVAVPLPRDPLEERGREARLLGLILGHSYIVGQTAFRVESLPAFLLLGTVRRRG